MILEFLDGDEGRWVALSNSQECLCILILGSGNISFQEDTNGLPEPITDGQ